MSNYNFYQPHHVPSAHMHPQQQAPFNFHYPSSSTAPGNPPYASQYQYPPTNSHPSLFNFDITGQTAMAQYMTSFSSMIPPYEDRRDPTGDCKDSGDNGDGDGDGDGDGGDDGEGEGEGDILPPKNRRRRAAHAKNSQPPKGTRHKVKTRQVKVYWHPLDKNHRGWVRTVEMATLLRLMALWLTYNKRANSLPILTREFMLEHPDRATEEEQMFDYQSKNFMDDMSDAHRKHYENFKDVRSSLSFIHMTSRSDSQSL
jgi:hypothetical protein